MKVHAYAPKCSHVYVCVGVMFVTHCKAEVGQLESDCKNHGRKLGLDSVSQQ